MNALVLCPPSLLLLAHLAQLAEAATLRDDAAVADSDPLDARLTYSLLSVLLLHVWMHI